MEQKPVQRYTETVGLERGRGQSVDQLLALGGRGFEYDQNLLDLNMSQSQNSELIVVGCDWELFMGVATFRYCWI